MPTLAEIRARNDVEFARLKEFSPAPAREPRPPRIAHLVTRSSTGDTAAHAHTPRRASDDRNTGGRDQFPRSVRAFTRVFDEPLRRSSTAGTPAGTVAVKDMIAVRGHTNGCGCAAYLAPASEVTATVVERLLAAHWAVVGMTNMHAMAYGTTGLVSEIGPAVNALDPHVVPGGSSSGSAVAVAVGDVAVALGTDTGGSIRIPAALNGVVGFKPTHGRVPVDGVVPLAPSLDHVGPIGRTVADTAAAFVAIDDTSRSSTLLDGASDLRIGVPRSHFLDELDALTRDSFDHLVELLDGFDTVQVSDVELDHTEYVPAAQSALLTSEAGRTHAELVRNRGDHLPEELQLRFASGLAISDDVVVAARRLQREWIATIDRSLEHVDVLLTPTVAVASPRTDQPTCRTEKSEFLTGRILQRLTSPFNLSGHPAISIPFWEGHRRIPLGAQLITAKDHDHSLLAIGEHLETFLVLEKWSRQARPT